MTKGLQIIKENKNLAEWSRQVEECRNSGLSMRSWCEQHQIAVSTFHYRQQKVWKALQKSSQFVEVPLSFDESRGNIIAVDKIAASVRIGGSGSKVYLACGYTDLRRGIDGLATIIEQQFHLDPCSDALFLFCGRRTDRIKALYWEGDGFLLLYKRLEKGKFQWPRSENEALGITAQQYRWLMEGLSIQQPKAHRKIDKIKFG